MEITYHTGALLLYDMPQLLSLKVVEMFYHEVIWDFIPRIISLLQ